LLARVRCPTLQSAIQAAGVKLENEASSPDHQKRIHAAPADQ